MTIENLAVSVGAVVVHHKSPATLRRAVDALISDSVAPACIVVVDNSDDGSDVARLLPPDVILLRVGNDGYAAAANLGVRTLAASAVRPDFVIIATHEVQTKPGTVRALVDALAADERVGFAGPTVVSGDVDAPTEYWSTGGRLSTWLRLPRHYDHKSRSIDPATADRRRTWFDGAFVAYRTSALLALPIPEIYFLYMEEVDAQLQLTRAGYAGVWVPDAVISQTSSGVPNYYLTRNTILLGKRHGSTSRSLIAAAYESLRKMRTVRAVRDLSVAKDLGRGFLHGVRCSPPPILADSRVGKAPNVTIINPLAGALAHYSRQLRDTLKASGSDVTVLSFSEPSRSGAGRGKWMREYLRALVEARSERAAVISVWPLVGLFDLVLLKALLGRRASLIIHDPEPLVKAVGYGRFARNLAHMVRVPIIVHTEVARDDLLRRQGLRSKVVPHPFLDLRDSPSATRSSAPTVLVFGQYKPERDLTLMRDITRLNTQGRFSLEVVGRGWPPVDGWTVRSEFVPESEIPQLLAAASVVLIPYTRFFQSGVAIRAFEVGAPVVGPESESLRDLWGNIGCYLVDPGGSVDLWWSALERASTHGRADLTERIAEIQSRNVDAWSRWVKTEGRQ